jgi:hypothetical protein
MMIAMPLMLRAAARYATRSPRYADRDVLLPSRRPMPPPLTRCHADITLRPSRDDARPPFSSLSRHAMPMRRHASSAILPRRHYPLHASLCAIMPPRPLYLR